MFKIINQLFLEKCRCDDFCMLFIKKLLYPDLVPFSFNFIVYVTCIIHSYCFVESIHSNVI